MLKKLLAYFSLLFILPATLFAQSVDEISKKFPGEQSVVLNRTLHYKIKIKDDVPQVESKDVQQILYLSANAAAYMSQYGFSHSGFHQLGEYEAYTKTAENKKVKVTNFKTTSSKSNSIFYDDIKETNFDFPAIAPGAVGTLELNLKHTDAHLLSPFYFTRRIPVVYSELKISFPKDMSIKYLLKGNNNDKIQFTQETKRGEIIYTFKVSDMPAEKTYPDAPDDAYYSPHVIFYIEHYLNAKNEKVNFLGSLDDLYRLNYSFIKNINKEISPELKSVVDSVTRNIQSPEEKAKRIYQWVQNNIKYVAFEAGMEGFVPREANLVCTRRFGDCKDMSSILTVMLNQAGIPAYYTWIGTRHIPYKYSEVPTPIVDNHMICTINLNGKYIFLDGTDATCVFGIPSEGIQGKEAFLSINEKEYKVLPVPIPEKEKNMLVDTTFLELTDKGIKGSISIDMSGYYAMDMHGLLNYTNEKDREKYLKGRFNRGSNKFKLEKFEIGDRNDKNTIRLMAQFDLQDYAKKVADEWYLNLNLFKHYEHDEIDYPRRQMPIEFPYRFQKKYITILKIPDGYSVGYLPQSKSFKNDVWGFDMKFEQKGNQVILTQQFNNEHMLLQPEKFSEWNKVLEQLYPLYKETISLIKK